MTKIPPKNWEGFFYSDYLEIDGNSAARSQSSERVIFVKSNIQQIFSAFFVYSDD